MNWRKNPVSRWKLYCIIDNKVIREKDPRTLAQALFKNGAGVLQLRYKNFPSYKFIRIAKKIRRLADKYGKSFVINDRVDVALASNATGVHLGSGDMPPGTARNLLGRKGIIGKTLHSVRDADKVRDEKINYVSAGPLFSTPLKKNLKKQGTSFIKKIKKRVPFPLFAIGGINRRNIRGVLKEGADGVCVTRAVFDVKNLLKEFDEKPFYQKNR